MSLPKLIRGKYFPKINLFLKRANKLPKKKSK